MEFSQQLKELRTEEGLSQAKLASKLNVSKSSISFWENGQGEPTIYSIILIAQFFGVSIDYLLGLED